VPLVDEALVRIGRAIGKPPGWERIVRALAPPSYFAGGQPRRTPIADGYMFPIDPGTIIGWHIHFFGSYEPEVRAEIRRWLSPGASAVDIGANVGWHALLMATIVGPAGHVYAFEPNESTRARLSAAIDANGLRQITIDPRALSDRIGTTGFEAPQAGDVWDGTGRMTAASADGSATAASVTCTTLDRFVEERRIDRLDLIKIDIEGWEQTALSGARRTLERLAPSIVFEYDPAYVVRCGGSGDGLTTLFTGAGYTLFRLDPKRAPLAVPSLGDVGGNFLAVHRTRRSAA
jgi:FkbM family methyltransferase